ncbi:9302_t:CDS:2 [Gigaspora margarita]|uniref:9302_t:CDS:1 n=1 Tax=Gigaspora margarita TaxID=4874 RepID=A0ABN7UKY4_GIGMA|nr:9302_t:CDS:2 [Gigaspora margarita]
MYDRIEYKIGKKIKICKKEEVLIGSLDFEQEEIKSKIKQTKAAGLTKHDNLIERVIANIKQTEVHSKIKMKVVDKIVNESDKIEDISSPIWASVSKSLQNIVSYKRKDKLGLTL